jgi:hypothetical protein
VDFRPLLLPTIARLLIYSPSNSYYFSFGKSTALYASWLLMFIVVGEFTTGKLTDWAWTANNYGKTFPTVEWSKFDNFEEKEDDDEDDDE